MSVGFEKRTLFIGTPFLPIQITLNGYMKNITTDPPLLQGLFLDQSTRQISGIYNGDEVTVEYKIVATDENSITSSSFVLVFTCSCNPPRLSLAISESMSAIDSCSYSLAQPLTPLPTEWYATHSADSCNIITELHIPNSILNSTHPFAFTISMLGYIRIPFSGVFSFLLNCTTGARVLLDGATVLSVFDPDQPMIIQQSQSLSLAEGLHFLQAYFISTASTASTTQPSPFFSLFYRNDHFPADWILINASLLRQGGVGPQYLHVPSLMGCAHVALAPSVPAVSGGQCIFSVSPALPEGLTLDEYTGIIDGTLEVVTMRVAHT